MNQQEAQLRKEVMIRVWTVYFMRLVFNMEVLKGLVFGGCLSALIFMVSVPNVVRNMSHLSGFSQDAAYLYSAFIHTSLLVESAIAVAAVAGSWLLYDLLRNVDFSRYVKGFSGMRKIAMI